MHDVMMTIWRSFNFSLSVIGLLFLLIDVRNRRRVGARGRFYWQAMALLLISAAYGSLLAVFDPETSNPIRTALTTVALVYFVISIARIDGGDLE